MQYKIEAHCAQCSCAPLQTAPQADSPLQKGSFRGQFLTLASIVQQSAERACWKQRAQSAQAYAKQQSDLARQTSAATLHCGNLSPGLDGRLAGRRVCTRTEATSFGSRLASIPYAGQAVTETSDPGVSCLWILKNICLYQPVSLT